MEMLLIPPVAFLIYLVLVGLLSGLGRTLSEPNPRSPLKTSTYASGEAPANFPAVPGYRPFFIVALFFAILHLGILILGTSSPSPIAAIYLVGLLLALVVLILR